MSLTLWSAGSSFSDIRPTSTATAERMSAYPTTEAEWQARYNRLMAFYVGDAYSSEESKAFHLFRAMTEDGKEIAQAKRLFGAFRHIVNTDVAGVLNGGLTLEASEDATTSEAERQALLVMAEKVWRRSGVGEHLERWLKAGATVGALGFEVVRRSDGRAVLMGYDARSVRVFFDAETGTVLERVVIETQAMDPDDVDGRTGVVTSGALHVYRREITTTEVKVWRDGRPVDGPESGPHKLGVVPFVWVPWDPCPDPEHGFSAAHGVEGALMRADSAMEEIGAIGNRYGWPMLVCKGFRLDEGSDLSKFGRLLQGVPADGGVESIVAGAEAIEPLLKTIEACLADIRQAPEFLFTDAGANESGEARSYKAAAFEMKIQMVRNRLFTALGRAVLMGVLMDQKQAYTSDLEDREVFTIDAGPILPRNLRSDLDAYTLIKADLTRADRVRYLQARGLIGSDQDPETYARQVDEETATRAAEFFTSDPNGRPNVPPDAGSA